MRRSVRQAAQRNARASRTTTREGLERADNDTRLSAQETPNQKKRTWQSVEPADGKDDDYQVSEEETKRKKKRSLGARKTNGRKNGSILDNFGRIFGDEITASDTPPCQLPLRAHNVYYHRPILLDSREGRKDLLDWFDGVSSLRAMPWRKPWINPRLPENSENPESLRQKLERRAYEVWISEIMLQQTRVAVVINYWNRWMEKWPTIHDLAAARPDDVLAAWRGLGYYSRATRIHDAAHLVCSDPTLRGLLPSEVGELVAKVPGVGRYTAGAISAIVFGRAAPMVDGNVLRVLSRQLGLLGDVKTDKAVIDLLWAAADSLVKAVSKDRSGEESPDASAEASSSDRPGRWGQALMELGSTVCTPKPDCGACPIQKSCRAYGEGLQLASKRGLAPGVSPATSASPLLPDIEDSCNFCKPLQDVLDSKGEADGQIVPLSKTVNRHNKRRPRFIRQSSLSAFFEPSEEEDKGNVTAGASPAKITRAGLGVIVDHAKKFPVKVVKKAVKEQETLVCAIRSPDGKYLLHRRPSKGLLAGLWEFPSWIVPEDYVSSAEVYQRAAELFASGVLDPSLRHKSLTHRDLRCVGRLGSVPWLFSHLKLTMHVFLFELSCAEDEVQSTLSDSAMRWSDTVEDESMGTGMRKCWELVRDKNGD
ncbi:DNA glycosylase [Xylariaceae sp. FL0594]|nr:DNA glycosylase [Xylariaceae sp. FL0594]